MNEVSAVTFIGDRRIHLGLGVQDMAKSIDFYVVLNRTIFRSRKLLTVLVDRFQEPSRESDVDVRI